MKNPTSFRLPDLTTRQLGDLIAATGMTQSEVAATAIDRMHKQETQTTNTQTRQMLDELKAATKLNRHEREQLEDRYADKLPLHSGTISYTPDLVSSIIEQVERHVQSWEHASTITDIPHAPDPEMCQEQIRWGREIIEYLHAK